MQHETLLIRLQGGLDKIHAVLAKIHNRGYAEQARLEGKDDQAVITNWSNYRARLEWMVAVNKPGTFKVLAEIASTEENSCVIEIGEQSLEAKLAPTGDAGKYIKTEIGTIQIKNAGNHVLEFAPKKDQWKDLSLRSIHLELTK